MQSKAQARPDLEADSLVCHLGSPAYLSSLTRHNLASSAQWNSPIATREPTMNDSSLSHRNRIARLRDEMRATGVHAVLVPSCDPHVSEYLAPRWKGREWLSGFTGSAGSLVVTLDKAALFTDSRYWEQADAQLAGSGIELVRMAFSGSMDHLDWISRTLRQGEVLSVDGQVLSLIAAGTLRTALSRFGMQLRTDLDLVGDAWDNRPELPSERIYEQQPAFVAASRYEKLAQIRHAMAIAGATHHLISSTDDVAWILNLRGSDVQWNPVFAAHLLLDLVGGKLFISIKKVPREIMGRLSADGIQLLPYEDASAMLSALETRGKLMLDPRRVTLGLRQAVPVDVEVLEQVNPSTLAKSRKTDREARLIREAMAQDGAAMCAFYADFEASLARGDRWSELDVDTRLTAERRKRPGFVGPSFATIAGWMANGALPHYCATTDSFSWIEGDGLLLIDSGGQYLGGTTDITRVWPIGVISAEQKRDYTLVLKGMLALSRARFPQGTLSPMLDSIARAPLWAHGMDYAHGTGHGVGCFLNVHEGPQVISKVIADGSMAMQPGMVTSIEPGLYRKGRWGIRLENLVLNVPFGTPEKGAFGDMLAFETLTLCPIDTRCIESALLEPDEVDWLNSYHAKVRFTLMPLTEGAARDWLITRTEPIAPASVSTTTGR